MSRTLLITGAAGYIGSHFVEEIYESAPAFLKGARIVLVDDLSSGHEAFIQTLETVAILKGFSKPEFHPVSLLDQGSLHRIFEQTKPDAVLHFAAKISVAESVERPDFYLENNVQGSLNLIGAMKASGCTRMVFSSTAAVYGAVEGAEPVLETATLKPINPYGESKLQVERVIETASKNFGLQAVIFRYFNAAGASLTGRLGEHHEPETHLIPLLLRAAISEKPIQIYGNDYPTRDGSCVRDYIHVKDLASAHLLGLEKLFQEQISTPLVYNLGTETGTSVLEVVEAAEAVTGKKIIRDLKPRRVGDSVVLVADSKKARKELGWTPQYSEMRILLKTVLDWEMNHRVSQK